MDANSQAERVFQDQLPHFRQWQGWFALIGRNRLGGVFSSYAAAQTAGQAMYGDGPILIRQIPSAAGTSPTPISPPGSSRKADSAGKRRKTGTDDASRYVA